MRTLGTNTKRGAQFPITDLEAHPSCLQSYIFATMVGTASMVGRFVDAFGNNVIVNPDADTGDQVTQVTLSITVTARTFAELLVVAAIDNGVANVTRVPDNAVGFRGSVSDVVYFTNASQEDSTYTASDIGTDANPTAYDAQFGPSVNLTFGRIR